MAGNGVGASHFPDVHTLESPLKLIFRDWDHTLIANRVASFCNTFQQTSASTVNLEVHIESIQLVSQIRVSSHRGGGFASEGTDCPQSLPRVRSH